MSEHQLHDLTQELSANAYPGRGILIGTRPGGEPLIVYFIMGRSDNSRNRVFVPDALEVIIEPFDLAKVEDPSLIIYRPLKQLDQQLIISNGDQTDTIYQALLTGGSFDSALRSRRFEPDAPNFTPRISGLLDERTGHYRLSILKAADAQGQRCDRQFFEYEAAPGIGHFIHTYAQDGNPLPSFKGEPLKVSIPQDMAGFAAALWQALNHDNRVALLARSAGQLRVHNRQIRRDA